jgi:hypothetical protein
MKSQRLIERNLLGSVIGKQYLLADMLKSLHAPFDQAVLATSDPFLQTNPKSNMRFPIESKG